MNWLQRCTTLALPCLLFIAGAPASAQWQTYPTPERTISGVTPYRTAAGTIYLTIGFTAPKRYLYRSTDGGRSWSGTLTDPILRIFTAPMATDPPGLDGALYAVVQTSGDWLSGLAARSAAALTPDSHGPCLHLNRGPAASPSIRPRRT